MTNLETIYDKHREAQTRLLDENDPNTYYDKRKALRESLLLKLGELKIQQLTNTSNE